MDAPRTLLLAADPVAAWRGRDAAAPAADLVLLASSAARTAFGVTGPATTLERWARRPPLVVAPPLARRRALVAAVADAFAEGADASFDAADAPGYASTGAEAVRALLRANAMRGPGGAAPSTANAVRGSGGAASSTANAVRAAADADADDLDGEAPVALGPRGARWWRVAAGYRRRLRARGACDPAEVRGLAAARAAAAGERRTVVLLGHATLAPDEVALVDALSGPGSCVVLPHDPPWTDANAPAVADLVARGWSVVHGPPAEAPAPRAAWSWPTLEDEARGAVAEVKRLRAAGVPAAGVVLAARAPDRYAEALFAAAEDAGVAVRVDRWLPLAATPGAAPIVAWLEAVARGGAFEPTLAWLAHPAVGVLDAEAVARVRTWRPSDPRAWRRAVAPAVDGAVAPEARARADAVVAALAWPERARASAWRARLGDALAAVAVGRASPPGSHAAESAGPGAEGWDAEAAADPAVAVAWAAALDALGDVLGEPDAAERDADPTLARGVVLAALRDALRHTLVRWSHPAAAPSDPAADEAASDPDDAASVRADAGDAVWLRPLEALTDRRPAHVLLLGAVDGVLPTAVADDPVLGFRERAALAARGWPFASAGDAARLEALGFWGTLRAARDRVWIGVPAQTGGDARLPSPFLARIGLEPAAPPTAPPASPGAFRAAALRAFDRVPDGVDAVLAGARGAWRQALDREAGRTWGPDDGFVGVGVDRDARVWSATQLRVLGSCRFRWWVERVWGVRAPDEGAEELTPLLEGRLHHVALEGALRAAVGLRGGAARAAALDALDAAFVAAEAAERLEDVVPHWSRLRAEHLAHLRALIEAPDFLPDDHEVVGTEDRFEGVWHGWRVQGYVDRIDRTPDGIELIDYKLSGRPPVGARDAELEPTLDLQLPLYVDVAAPALRPGEPVAGAAYLSLRTRARVKAQPPGADDLADLLRRLQASLAAGFFPPEPDPSVCRLCDLEAVCRKGPHLERRPAPHRVPDVEAAAP